MSTGDSRRPATPNTGKSTGEPAETVADGPKGGVLPVKKAAAANGSRARAGVAGASRTTGGAAGGTRSASAAKATPSKAAPVKATPTKATPVKAAPVKAAAAKAAPKVEPVLDEDLDDVIDLDEDFDEAAEATPARTTTAGARTAAATRTAGSARTTTTTRTAAKAGGRSLFAEAPAKGRPATGGGGKNRRPTAPVKVAESRNWGPIALFGAVAVLVLAIIGYAAWPSIRDATKPSWQEQVGKIAGVQNYTGASWLTRNHQSGVLTYQTDPPVGGDHNPSWQNCMGDVYTEAVPKEQATHSLEHGAIWVTYRPDLPADQVAVLAGKVRNKPFMLMSPYPGLDQPISLQVWGYQLKVSDASDSRIDEFIKALGGAADSQEPGAVCSGGITDPGTVPLDMAGTGMDSSTGQ